MNRYNPYALELYHHGIKGQKWGVRNYQNADGTWTNEGLERRRAENYSDSQRLRDERVYSKGAVKRINEKMLNGESIQGARSYEADRIEKYRNITKVAKKVAPVIGVAAGIAIGNVVIAKTLTGMGGLALSHSINAISNPTLRTGAKAITRFLYTNRVAAVTGFAAAGGAAANGIAKTVVPAVGGYKPEKMR